MVLRRCLNNLRWVHGPHLCTKDASTRTPSCGAYEPHVLNKYITLFQRTPCCGSSLSLFQSFHNCTTKAGFQKFLYFHRLLVNLLRTKSVNTVPKRLQSEFPRNGRESSSITHFEDWQLGARVVAR